MTTSKDITVKAGNLIQIVSSSDAVGSVIQMPTMPGSGDPGKPLPIVGAKIQTLGPYSTVTNFRILTLSGSIVDTELLYDPNRNNQAIVNDNNGVPVLITLSPPAGFTWDFSQLDFNVQYYNQQANVNFTNLRGLIPAAVWQAPLTQIFHVDAVSGSNANTGISTTKPGDFTNALADVTTAFTKANTSATASIILINGKRGSVFNLSTSGSAPHLTVPAALISMGGITYFTAENPMGSVTVNGTYNNVYQYTQAACTSGLDLLNTYNFTYLKNGVQVPGYDVYGNQCVFYNEFTKVNSIALVSTTPGNVYYNDGTNTYLKRADSLVPSAANSRMLNAFAFNHTSATAKSLYVQGIEFHGGSNVTIANTMNLIFDHCRWLYNGQSASGNGISIDNLTGVVVYLNCEAHCNGADGFNFHGTAGKAYQLTYNCRGYNNGRAPSTSNQGLTSHDNTVMCDVNGIYAGNHGANLRSINNSKTWCVNTQSYGDNGDVALGGGVVPTSFAVDTLAEYWLDFCIGGSVPNCYQCNTNTAFIYTRNCIVTEGGFGSLPQNILEFKT